MFYISYIFYITTAQAYLAKICALICNTHAYFVIPHRHTWIYDVANLMLMLLRKLILHSSKISQYTTDKF